MTGAYDRQPEGTHQRRTPSRLPVFTRFLVVGMVGLIGLSGCSQLEQLQPVAGDQITAINFATADVLHDADVAVQTWPVCRFEDPRYVCTGTSIDGTTITATTGATRPYQLTVRLGNDEIFQGSVQDVLESAGQQ